MKGCHNCEYAGKVYPTWEECPCSRCAEPVFSESSPEYDAIAYAEEYADDDYPGKEKDTRSDWVRALSSCVLALVDLSREHPETFKYCIEKIRDPGMSYRDIAAKFGCRKQNVDYHLKRGCFLVPQLRTAFLVDQRFNASA